MKNLHPNARILFLLKDLFYSIVIFTVAAVILLYVNQELFWKLIGINSTNGELNSFGDGIYILYLLGVIFVWPIIGSLLEFKHFQYQIEEDRMLIKKGLLNQKETTIPFNKIQNIDIDRNFLARLLKLSELHIQTAGEQESLVDSTLPGVEPSEAIKIRDAILNKISRKEV